ncbi:MAG: PEGA domain-containing protein [Deltaproteobacteria bacterium]|nr:PEGA domain-containing protein [Deltaproteobacteria bacterium]MBW2218279.1 PEGA domain-containing protein [Deltaproteobacteria bacterium]
MRQKYSEMESIKSLISKHRIVADRYLIKMPIREDATTLEYMAYDREKERNIAFRVLPDKQFNNRYAVKTLKRETELALTLEHDHIIRLYSFEKWKSFLFTTAEYVPGVTLSQYLLDNGGRLPFEEVIRLLRPVAEAIDFAHARNPAVIHGDIRPETILVKKEGIAKVADFGVSRAVSEIVIHRSPENVREAVLPYKAPEQISEEGIVDPGTDIYALAAIAYELIAGKPHFDTNKLRRSTAGEDVPKIVGIPDAANNALFSGLAKNVKERPDKAGDFIALLADDPQISTINEKTGEPVDEKKKVEEEKKPKEAKEKAKKPVFLYAVLSTLLLLATGFGWYYFKKMPDKRTVSHTIIPEAIPLKMRRADVTEAKSVKTEKVKKVKKRKLTKPPLGDLNIVSIPSEAYVYLDNRRRGKTPLKLFKLKKGTYALMVKKEGYHSFHQNVEIFSVKMTQVSATLKAANGSIHITSKPMGASVFINDQKLGKTPFDMTQMKPGRHKVVIKRTGYNGWKQEVDIKPGEAITLFAEMGFAYGSLSIKSRPSNADVYIEGKKRGKTPVKLKKLKKGSIKIEVKKECFGSAVKSVSIRENKISEYVFTLKPICGSVSIKSNPAAAQWYLDGEYVGITPGKIKNVKKGSHKIKVTLKDHIDWVQTIDVQDGIMEIIDAEFEPIPPQQGEESIDPVTQMEFVWIEKGCFMMGAKDDELGKGADETPYHEACLKNGFWIGKYEVTQGQWVRVIGNNPSFFSKGDDYPVENVSWNDVNLFIEKINRMNTDGKVVYRLPTEAEWEYACKSGDNQEILSGDIIGTGLVAWFVRNSQRTTHPSGWKAPNRFQLHDMLGNVYEWVADIYDEDAYLKHQKINPIVRGDSEFRVIRGGSWYHSENESRCANRHYYKSDSGNYFTGFRLVKERSKR